MSQGMSPSKSKVAAISIVTMFRKRFGTLSIATLVLIGSLPCGWSKVMGWDRPFDQPVPHPSGAPARTLRDAANYIKTLPKSVRDSNEWRLAVQMLIDAAEDRGPMLFAKMGILRAVEHHVERRQRGGHLHARKSVSVKRLEG